MAALADPKVQPYALHIRVLGLPGGASDVVRGQGLYGALGEWESHHGLALLSGRSLGYSAAVATRCSEGMVLWKWLQRVRSRSGPEVNFGDGAGGATGGGGKGKGRGGSPGLWNLI